MKYCRVCKIRAKDTDTVCDTCGKPLATFGGRPDPNIAGPAKAEPTLTLQGQIRQLQVVHQRNVRRSTILGLVCAGIALALLITFYLIYDYTVLSYAMLENVEIKQNPRNPRQIIISFNVVKPGKVAFDRRSGKYHTEKFDVISKIEPYGPVAWTWPSDPEAGIDINVVYRGGLTRKTVSNHFGFTEPRH